MSILKDGINLTKGGFFQNAILFASFFTFYFVFLLYLIPEVVGSSIDPLTMQTIFSFTVAGTMILSSFLRHKLLKRSIIFVSAALTSLFTFFLLFASGSILSLLSVLIVGVFFAIGQLLFFIQFWNSTFSEERGRVGGVIGIITLPFYFVINTIAASGLGIFGTVLITTVLALVPVVVIALKPIKIVPLVRRPSAFPEKRTIFLYLIPWILFSIIDTTLAKNIALGASQVISPSAFELIVILQTVAALVGTLLGGFLVDFFGRRPTLVLSVTLYGIGMALSGLIQSATIAFFAFFAEGLSWGILLIIYSFVIWGDLANKENCSKLYAIGLAVFYMAVGVGRIPTEIFLLPVVASALLGCSLIFFSNVPIALAPELQSADFREKIMMKMHIKAAKKTAKEFENH